MPKAEVRLHLRGSRYSWESFLFFFSEALLAFDSMARTTTMIPMLEYFYSVLLNEGATFDSLPIKVIVNEKCIIQPQEAI
jgi:hypothetical protein